MDSAWDSEAVYRALSAALAEAVQNAVKQKIPIGLNKSTSNLFRERTPVRKYKLDVRRLDRVLRINSETMTADVEGMTTYETLVEETLKFDLLPTVVPELETITIGGAVSGLGIESSSFKYGLVHEAIQNSTSSSGMAVLLRAPRRGTRIFSLDFRIVRHPWIRLTAEAQIGSR